MYLPQVVEVQRQVALRVRVELRRPVLASPGTRAVAGEIPEVMPVVVAADLH